MANRAITLRHHMATMISVTDEVAEVDAGYKRMAISAGKRGSATSAKIGLQPFENFFLRFHGRSHFGFMGGLVQNNFFHHGNHLATVPSNSNGGSTVRRKPCSQ